MNEFRSTSMKSSLQKPDSSYMYHSSPYQSFSNPKGTSSSNLSVGVESFTSSEDGQPVVEGVASFSNSPGNANSSCVSSELNVDCQHSMQQKTKSLIEQLQGKINKTKERIKLEQTAKQDNVNEYLKLSNDADRQQLQRIKAVFEKKNLKSAQVVAQLQRKLDEYDKKLKEISTYGVPVTHRPSKGGRLKDVSQGLKDFFARDPVRSRDASPCATGKGLVARNPATLPGVSKARDNSHIFKNRYGSVDNITSSIKLSNQDIPTRDDDSEHVAGSRHKEGSDGEASSGLSDSLASGEYLSMKRSSSKNRDEAMPSPIQQQQTQQQNDTTNQEPSILQAKDLATIVNNLAEFQKAQYELHCSVEALKTQLEEESMFYRQALDEEHDRCERLEEQINDLTELHQNEVFNIKQELIGMQEKLEYQLEERTRDMQELLLTCQTKINKMELQQQQLISMEGIENTSFRGLVTKLINVALALLAVILVLVSGVANLIGPFLQTRFRVVSTALVACVAAILWNNWLDFCQFLEQFSRHSTQFSATCYSVSQSNVYG